MTKDYIILVDGNSYLYKAFYGIPVLSTKTGQHTNAIYGFLRMVIKSINKFKPKKFIIAFDAKDGAKKRQDLHDRYKSHRQPMPDNLISQLKPLYDILYMMNIPVYKIDGVEADDTIAKLIFDFKHSKNYNNTEVLIISSDKDLLQYVDDNIKVYDVAKDQMIGEDIVYKKWGIKPSQIKDLLALMGDSSDNIPGIYGIGEKTAVNLLQRYGSIESIFNSINNIKGKLKDKIIEGKDMALLSYELASPNLDVDIRLDDISELNIKKGDDLINKLKELELFSILKELNIDKNIDENDNIALDNSTDNNYIVLDNFSIQVGDDIITADYKKLLYSDKLHNVSKDNINNNKDREQISIF